jgi:hypothetical protein
MPVSTNGWPASKVPQALGAVTYDVPGVPNRRFTTVEVAAPLFKYLIRRFHYEVDPLTGGVFDEWSYNYRPIRTGSALSCHASATAVDLDATQFPMGRANMTRIQRAKVKQILGSTFRQFRWGGDFRMPYTDEMHFELAPGTNKVSVRSAIARMGLHPDGRQLHPNDLRAGAPAVRVKLLKRALAKVGLYPRRPAYNGTWTPRLSEAWTAWQSKRPHESVQTRIDVLGWRSGLF